MKTAEIRTSFVEFFTGRDHRHLPGSPLVPRNDPTLLFTNAGMVQFKDIFLGREQPPHPRAVTVQRCLRAGGKHNDLENVGYTARHHTFFEMLGNFSFGDYFKREAVRLAWEFVTRDLGLPSEKLLVTIYEDDDEAARCWREEAGIGDSRIIRLGGSGNFWSMGDTGPCGPCSEIFYDHGPDVSGGPPGSAEEEGDRFVEIWNLVFMQFDRDAEGHLTDLPKPSVDTGMGLERTAAVLQGVSSNYEIDLFRDLIAAAGEITGTSDLGSNSLKVIADHARAAAFLVGDGVFPSNEGRGYVLRRIIRRALRHGHDLGVNDAFLYRMVAPIEEAMGAAFPELAESRELAERVLRAEEERFAATLEQGMRYLNRTLEDVRGGEIPGEKAFVLYDTYGFPVDLTADIARGRGLSVDMPGYDAAMARQRERSRSSSGMGARQTNSPGGEGVPSPVFPASEFTGYERLENPARVIGIRIGDEAVERAEKGKTAEIVLDRTPFYAESGGQVGDTGMLAGQGLRFDVRDTQLTSAGRAHIGVLAEGTLSVGDEVTATVDAVRRRDIVLNHSATHLMNAALRRVLGKHVAQKGSLVAPDRLRFDFSHFEAVSPEDLERIEDEVNGQIRANEPAVTTEMPIDEAIEAGALSMAGEDYAEKVRVLKLGDYSMELCGGTHVGRTGDIGLFAIVSESSVAAGVRRIEALTGAGAFEWVRKLRHRMGRLAGLLKGGADDSEEKLSALMKRARDLEKKLAQARAKLAEGGGAAAMPVTRVGDVNLIAMRLDDDSDMNTMCNAVDRYRDRFSPAVVVLGTRDGNGKARIVAGVSKALEKRAPARDLARAVAKRLGGKGGGRAGFAQGGGPRGEALGEALDALSGWLQERLGDN
ncbi:MAG: alanine--tRNA ligase [Gammaproteobacteria bacterium]|nr:alanine--tRNA ligase [Gammaproteobacteria bacterium]MYD03103.1 alanine--tRNA ligase [Gammaproteobacteria bacterium]MYI25726.1 alanine--tRNA ligase [Gammaproteobacteria bacterium]